MAGERGGTQPRSPAGDGRGRSLGLCPPGVPHGNSQRDTLGEGCGADAGQRARRSSPPLQPRRPRQAPAPGPRAASPVPAATGSPLMTGLSLRGMRQGRQPDPPPPRNVPACPREPRGGLGGRAARGESQAPVPGGLLGRSNPALVAALEAVQRPRRVPQPTPSRRMGGGGPSRQPWGPLPTQRPPHPGKVPSPQPRSGTTGVSPAGKAPFAVGDRLCPRPCLHQAVQGQPWVL